MNNLINKHYFFIINIIACQILSICTNHFLIMSINPEILVEHYLSEGALTRDMVTDYVKEVKIYGADDYRITWKYPELFKEMRVKANRMVVGLHHNPTR